MLVGGFARATRLKLVELRPDPVAVAALEGAEPGILEHMNSDHAEACRLICTRLLGGAEGPWRMAAVDVDGADFVMEHMVLRLAFPAPVADAAAVRRALVAASKAARAAHKSNEG
nr:DUF2470 domain-containing protein [Siccirubricoccus soli]